MGVARGLPRYGPAGELDREGHDLPPQPVAEARACPRRRSPPAGYQRCREFHQALCVGRKAWLFADTVAGAEASANLYSLVETAKANGIEPFAYLRLVFEGIPTAECLEDFEALLPHRLDRSLLGLD